VWFRYPKLFVLLTVVSGVPRFFWKAKAKGWIRQNTACCLVQHTSRMGPAKRLVVSQSGRTVEISAFVLVVFFWRAVGGPLKNFGENTITIDW